MKTYLIGKDAIFDDSFGSYRQSANSLFHFMNKFEYLHKALEKRILTPRYCAEKMEYLNIGFDKVGILMKCFCDIRLHSIAEHTNIYGRYALGFSKEWISDKNIQPVQYMNENSSLSKYICSAFEVAYKSEEQSNGAEQIAYENYLLNHLSLIKPLKGEMIRGKSVVKKNFHDEKEWRYLPDYGNLPEGFQPVISDPYLIQSDNLLKLNKDLEKRTPQDIVMPFEYEDIKYLIVPDEVARNRITIFIDNKLKLSCHEKYRLFSKIYVLSEIEKDW